MTEPYVSGNEGALSSLTTTVPGLGVGFLSRVGACGGSTSSFGGRDCAVRGEACLYVGLGGCLLRSHLLCWPLGGGGGAPSSLGAVDSVARLGSLGCVWVGENCLGTLCLHLHPTRWQPGPRGQTYSHHCWLNYPYQHKKKGGGNDTNVPIWTRKIKRNGALASAS